MHIQKSTQFAVVNNYIHAALTAPVDSLADAIRPFFADNFTCLAFRPVEKCNTVEQLAEKFWLPLRTAFTNLKRVPGVEIDGICALENTYWVSACGMYQGQFEHSLYTVPATRTLNHVRFMDFYHIENGKIVMVYKLMDYIGLMIRAGVCPLPPSMGSNDDTVCPRNQDGLLYGDANPDVTAQTQTRVMHMLSDLLHARSTRTDTQTSIWADDMIWYGPSGIGTFYGIDGFDMYRRAFLNTFPDRDYGFGHAQISKDNIACIVGWKNVIGTHMGSGWLGLAPTGKVVDMRVADFWYMINGRIAQNWVLLDVIDIFYQLGIDVFDMIDKIYHKTVFAIPDVPRKNHANTPEDIAFKNKLLNVQQ